jgi:hypothetical protein
VWLATCPVAPRLTAQVGSSASYPGSLDLGLTVTFDQVHDDLLAPLRWRGPGGGLAAAWRSASLERAHSLSFDVPLILLKNRFGHRGFALAPSVAYGYQARLGGGGDGSSRWVGARLRLDFHNTFYESWDDEHLYWLTAYGLGPSFSWMARPGDPSQAWAWVDVPLLAAVSRPPAARLNQIDRLTKLSGHLVDTQRRLTFTTLPSYASLHAGVGRKVQALGMSLILSYRLDWSTYDAPSRVSVLRQSITIAHRFSR